MKYIRAIFDITWKRYTWNLNSIIGKYYDNNRDSKNISQDFRNAKSKI